MAKRTTRRLAFRVRDRASRAEAGAGGFAGAGISAAFLCIALAGGCVSGAAAERPPPSIVLSNETVRAEIVPAWAGRLMFFGRPGGTNAFWTQPEAALFTVDVNGNPVWKNVGGEKTWVGSQDKGWRAFAGKESGGVWPPPAWFDSMPMDLVSCSPTGAVLRTGVHRAGDWAVRLERSFSLCGDRLAVRQRLIPESVGGLGPEAVPDDDRRLWSVAQIPRPDRVCIHLAGEGRFDRTGTMPAPVPSGPAGWAALDIGGMAGDGKISADGDRLAAPLPDGSGWLVLSQTAPARHLGAFETPGRAMVFASEPGFPPAPYVELEFAAFGPDAEQTVQFRIQDDPFAADGDGRPSPGGARDAAR